MSVGYNGTTEFSTIANVDELNNSRVATAAVWVFPTATTGTYEILSKTNTGAAPFMFIIHINATTPTVAATFDNAGTFGQGTTSASVTTNAWTHLAYVFNGGGSTNDENIKVYINGVDQAPLTFTGAAPTTVLSSNPGKAVHLGIREGGAFPFPGFVYNPRIWIKALSPSEIRQDVLNFYPTASDYLVAWAPFETRTLVTSFTPLQTVTHSTATADGGNPGLSSLALNAVARPGRRGRHRRNQMTRMQGVPLLIRGTN